MGFGKNYLNLESEIIAIKTVEQLIFLKAESTLISNNKNIPIPKISCE
jgi:fumarylpyruvate hydrolase